MDVAMEEYRYNDVCGGIFLKIISAVQSQEVTIIAHTKLACFSEQAWSERKGDDEIK